MIEFPHYYLVPILQPISLIHIFFLIGKFLSFGTSVRLENLILLYSIQSIEGIYLRKYKIDFWNNLKGKLDDQYIAILIFENMFS